MIVPMNLLEKLKNLMNSGVSPTKAVSDLQDTSEECDCDCCGNKSSHECQCCSDASEHECQCGDGKCDCHADSGETCDCGEEGCGCGGNCACAHEVSTQSNNQQ